MLNADALEDLRKEINVCGIDWCVIMGVFIYIQEHIETVESMEYLVQWIEDTFDIWIRKNGTWNYVLRLALRTKQSLYLQISDGTNITIC